MCKINAHCPNCGQPDLDRDETHCMILDKYSYREYRCHVCKAYVNVHAPVTPEQTKVPT